MKFEQYSPSNRDSYLHDERAKETEDDVINDVIDSLPTPGSEHSSPVTSEELEKLLRSDTDNLEDIE